MEHAERDVVNPRLMPVDKIFERPGRSPRGRAAQGFDPGVGGVVG